MLVSFVILCTALSFLGARSQKSRSSPNSAYNLRFSDSWNSNYGYSISNNKPPVEYGNNARTWESGFYERPEEKFSIKSAQGSNWGYETAFNSEKTLGDNLNKPVKSNSKNSGDWLSNAFNNQLQQKKLSSSTHLFNSSKWNTNSNNFQSNNDRDNNLASFSWVSNSDKSTSGHNNIQNSMTDVWNSNNFNNKKPNKNLSNYDYTDNSIYSSWSSENKKKFRPTSNSNDFNNRETTTSKSNKNTGTSKWDSNKNKKPPKFSETNSWSSNNSFQPGKEITSGSSDEQSEKKSSTLDTSILDELDKNDWYFGKESNYPKPPFRSTLNINVTELWNFDKNKKFNENNRRSSANNSINNKRRNRQTEGTEKEGGSIQCECVNVMFCEEQDMIVTQEDVKYDPRFAAENRSLDEFRCKDLTEVCCTNPKKEIIKGANISEEKERLRCGQRRITENSFEGLGYNIAQPGEFPWNLRLENEQIKCSASLIHHKLALTAAHCVAGKKPEDFILKAGIWNSNNEPSQSRQITGILTHPDYNGQNPRNDIALLILGTPFKLTDNVNTVCLPVTNDKWDSNQCIAVGWRQRKIQGQNLEVLEKRVVNFLPQVECQNILLITDLWRNYVLHDSFVCGLEKTGSKSCTEDEGSFVICPSKKQPDTYLQIGIISQGMNCDNFGRPGIFTNVLKFLDWINKNYFELGLFDDIDIRSLQ